MTEEEISDFNNIGVTFVEKIKNNFKDFAILENNIEDLDVGYEYDDLKKLHTWYAWIELKHSPVDSDAEFRTSISMSDSDFGKTKFKRVEEVETVIAEAIKDYVYGV